MNDEGFTRRQYQPNVRFRLTRFARFKLDEHDPYIVKGLWPESGLIVVWGPPKCGKSFWVFDLLMHVALGRDYRGHRVKQGSIVYCALEGAAGFKKRIEAFRKERLEPDHDPPFYLMTTPLSLVRDAEALVADIKTQLGGDQPIAVCIDTLNRSLAGSESSDEDMAAYIKAADTIRDAFGCLVVIVHHCGHEGQRPRGHSSLMGALDVQIAVRRDVSENIVAELELSKDGEVGLQFLSRLKVVSIGVDQDGEEITSCVIDAVEGEAAATKAPVKDKPIPKGAQIALRALQKAIADCGEAADASNTIPPTARAVKVSTWRTYAYNAGISASSEDRAKQKAFKGAYDALLAAGRVAVWNEKVWIP